MRNLGVTKAPGGNLARTARCGHLGKGRRGRLASVGWLSEAGPGPREGKAQSWGEGTARRLRPNYLFLEDPCLKAEEAPAGLWGVDICSLEAKRKGASPGLNCPEQGGLEG